MYGRDRAHYLNRFEALSLFVAVKMIAALVTAGFAAAGTQSAVAGIIITVLTVIIQGLSEYVFKLNSLYPNFKMCGTKPYKMLARFWAYTLLFLGFGCFTGACFMASSFSSTTGSTSFEKVKAFGINFVVSGVLSSELT